MAQFKVMVGKEEVVVKTMLKSLVSVVYKSETAFITVAEGKWKLHSGNLEEKAVKAIGKAIEKYLHANH